MKNGPEEFETPRMPRKAKNVLTQGAEANRSGQFGESMFEGAWQPFKVKIVNNHPSYHELQMFPHTERLLIRQVPLESAYRNTKADYLYKDFTRPLEVLFEVKSQLGGGSTDEKLFGTIETLATAPYPLCALVLFAEGFRKDILKGVTLKARELSNSNKRIRVIHAIGNVLYRQIRHLVDHGDFLW